MENEYRRNSIITSMMICMLPDRQISGPNFLGKVRIIIRSQEASGRMGIRYTLPHICPAARQTNVSPKLLEEWIPQDSCTILEAATLHGTLADASRANRQGRTLFIGFRNALWKAIQTRFHQFRGFNKRQGKIRKYQVDLLKHLHHCIDAMIARDMAALLWSQKVKVPITQAVRGELTALYNLIANPLYKWEMHIGHVIPRNPQFTSFGDACLTAGGAFCDTLEYWFNIQWSVKTKKATADNTIHITLLEFAVVIIQLAAVITITEEPELIPSVAEKFLNGILPTLAKPLICTDNSPSQNWAHKVSSRSEQGQQMVHIFAALLERTSLAISCTHIAGKDNSIADFISRPPTHMLSPAWWRLSLFPADARIHLQPGVQAVQRAMEGNNHTAKSSSDSSKPPDPVLFVRLDGCNIFDQPSFLGDSNVNERFKIFSRRWQGPFQYRALPHPLNDLIVKVFLPLGWYLEQLCLGEKQSFVFDDFLSGRSVVTSTSNPGEHETW
jgi:hypothetical protein